MERVNAARKHVFAMQHFGDTDMCDCQGRREMTKTWKTKFGPRRVRHDPPTLAEAITAAQGLTDKVSEQIEIAASLMGLAQEEVREAVMAAGSQRRTVGVVAVGQARSPRSVIVERKPARRMVTNRSLNR
jgi:hypothetical protein